MAKKNRGHAGGHGWFVTFADLMRCWWRSSSCWLPFRRRIRPSFRWSPVRCATRSACRTRCAIRHHRSPRLTDAAQIKNAAHIDPTEASATPGPDENDRERNFGARFKEDRKFSLASASLRQALQQMPEISEASKHIVVEESRDGLNIEIVDQDGRSMFPDAAKEPFERTRLLIKKLAPSLKAMPYRVSITAILHLPRCRKAGLWRVELSADRANAVRAILVGEGLQPSHIFMVAGKADTDPLFPDNPLDVAKSPGDHHFDAGRAADSGQFQP